VTANTSCKNFGFFFHVIDALYYSVVNVLPDRTPRFSRGAQLPGRGVQSPGLAYPTVERFGF
jgi:hypothetical protein